MPRVLPAPSGGVSRAACPPGRYDDNLAFVQHRVLPIIERLRKSVVAVHGEGGASLWSCGPGPVAANGRTSPSCPSPRSLT